MLQHATLLLDSSLEKCHWDLAKDLVRFLKAIGMYYDQGCAFTLFAPTCSYSPLA